MNTFGSLVMLVAAASCAEAYPTWPSVATWTGNASEYAGGNARFTAYYDMSGDVPKWAVTIEGTGRTTYIIGNTMYHATYPPMFETCEPQAIPEFPYPKNQFENATLVSTTDTIDGTPVDSWVGSSKLNYSISFATEKDVNSTMKRMVHINEAPQFGPTWTTVFNYHTVQYEVPKDALVLPRLCPVSL